MIAGSKRGAGLHCTQQEKACDAISVASCQALWAILARTPLAPTSTFPKASLVVWGLGTPGASGSMGSSSPQNSRLQCPKV